MEDLSAADGSSANALICELVDFLSSKAALAEQVAMSSCRSRDLIFNMLKTNPHPP